MHQLLDEQVGLVVTLIYHKYLLKEGYFLCKMDKLEIQKKLQKNLSKVYF
ncbi:type-2 restriction enzyme DpnI [Streptococcus pneumoniae GA14688]|nr:type-2 restriction enzyme DpnI [Streptococcus pneumoniae GA14688]